MNGMKTQKTIILLLMVLLLSYNYGAIAQTDTSKTTTTKIFIITTNDGGEFIGKIVSQDPKEVLVDTKDRGLISIPKYQIKEMHEAVGGEFSITGEYIPKEIFSTRYFITTNGLPIEKGENYVQWNIFGPDLEFGVGKNFGMGVMTSWVGVPIIGTAKYCIPLSKTANLAIGVLLGTGSWTAIDYGLALPYAALSFGDRRSNISFSLGYGSVFGDGESDGRMLMSVAGMKKIGKKISLVFDSFIVPRGGYHNVTEFNYMTGSSYTMRERKVGFSLLIPGIRWQMDSNKAFQFGFGGIVTDGELVPAPIPMIQWFRKL
jgi:hypothetical protein